MQTKMNCAECSTDAADAAAAAYEGLTPDRIISLRHYIIPFSL